MKVFNKATGAEHQGEPVDCRELINSGAWQDTQPTEEELAENAKAAPKAAAPKKPSRKKAD